MTLPTKIPTPIGILLVIALVVGVAIAFEHAVRSDTRASESSSPQNTKVTNVTDTSFTFTWTTIQPATGTLSVSGAQAKNKIVYDDRDTAGKLNKYITHSITVRDLAADSTYAIKVFSGGTAFTKNGMPFSATTAPSLPSSSTGLDPAYGTAVNGDNKPAEGALVYVTIEGAQTLSTVVSPSGSWLIPLSSVLSENLHSPLAPPEERYTEDILIQLDNGESSAITDTLNDSPVPTMILGKTYDFRKQQAKTNSAPIAQVSPSVLGDQIVAAASSQKVTLVAPAEGAALPTSLPLVQGNGIPGKSVTVTLGITNPISGTTTVGNDGLYRFSPKNPLGIGKQSVTITTVNSSGKPVAITHVFEVLKSGTQVLGDATPSATLEPTPTATSSPTPTSTLAGQPIPTTGSTLPTLILLVVSAGLMVSGAVVFIK